MLVQYQPNICVMFAGQSPGVSGRVFAAEGWSHQPGIHQHKEGQCWDDEVKLKLIKGYMSDSFTNYNYVGNTKVSVSIKKTYANKCTLSEIFLTEVLKSFSVF